MIERQNINYISSADMGHLRTRNNLSFLFNKYGIPNTMIEIGCFEGITTTWLADVASEFNNNFKIYAIDPHESLFDNDIHIDDSEKYNFDIIKQNFLSNIQKSVGKIIYINKVSREGLVDLLIKKEKAEVIFVDGDHTSASVLEDLVLSWRLLVPGGIMLCDDVIGFKFKDKHGCSPAQLSPRMGVEMFIQAYWHKIELIHLPDCFQTAFRKLED